MRAELVTTILAGHFVLVDIVLRWLTVATMTRISSNNRYS